VTRGEASLLPLLRTLRAAVYRSAAPLDFLFRSMNRLKAYPPLHLRRHVGGQSAGFNGPAYEFVAYLRLLADLRDGDSLWDLGCGCGLLELALHDLGWRGRLIGTDIHGPCIDWARKRLATRFDGHRFIHMDVFNAAYSPRGRSSARDWLGRFDESGFDVVVAKSFFTHVLPDELGVYLEQIAGRLRAGGTALLSFFLLSEEQALAAESGRSRLSFHPYAEEGRCAVRSPWAPTAAVAYERGYLTDRFRSAGFAMDGLTVRHGAWSGREGALSFQDIVLARK
jgi:SAM-dependent methyltransferase